MRPLSCCATALVPVALIASCGDRTGLTLAEPADAGIEDAKAEREPDVVEDAAPDVPYDVPFDIPNDVPAGSDCPDAAATLIYVITMNDKLYGFYPPSAAFSFIGNVECPGRRGGFSMAVDRKGIAYVLDDAGKLFRVDTANASCTTLPYVPGQHGFRYFGMGFATNGSGPSETLYIEGDRCYVGTGADGLARLDTTTWKVTPIGAASPRLYCGELTGTGGGELFAFFDYATDSSGARVGQLDKATGELMKAVDFPTLDIVTDSWAMAFWGGDFYLFTNGRVTQYSPLTGVTKKVAELGYDIVGAGVSTCAPQ